MIRTLNTLLLLVGLWLLTAQTPRAQTPVGGLCVWVSSVNPLPDGQMQSSCVPLSTVQLAGVPCSAPAAGIAVYAQRSDGSCEQIVTVPAPGVVARSGPLAPSPTSTGPFDEPWYAVGALIQNPAGIAPDGPATGYWQVPGPLLYIPQ